MKSRNPSAPPLTLRGGIVKKRNPALASGYSFTFASNSFSDSRALEFHLDRLARGGFG